MKPATLYTLQATEIVAGDYHLMVRSNMRPIFTANHNEAIAPMDVDHFAVPVHRVTRCIKPRTGPLSVSPWHMEREDVFFAMEPALAEILETPFRERAEEAERREQAATSLLRMAEASMTRFNSQPWWKRGWAAIRHGITF